MNETTTWSIQRLPVGAYCFGAERRRYRQARSVGRPVVLTSRFGSARYRVHYSGETKPGKRSETRVKCSVLLTRFQIAYAFRQPPFDSVIKSNVGDSDWPACSSPRAITHVIVGDAPWSTAPTRHCIPCTYVTRWTRIVEPGDT